MRFGVGADVCEAGGVGHARGLARFGISPALALLEFHGVIVEELVVRVSLEMVRVSFSLKPRHLAAIVQSK
jgi:hypothetical protein